MKYLKFCYKDKNKCHRCQKQATRIIIEFDLFMYDIYYYCEDCYKQWRKE